MFIVQMPEPFPAPPPLYRIKAPSSRATGRALVHMSFLPDASVGCYTQQEAVFHTSQLQLLSRKMSNSQNEVICHQLQVKDARRCFLYRATADFVPSAAISDTMRHSCLLIIKGMHLLVKGQSEEKRRRSPLLPSKSMCTFNGH